MFFLILCQLPRYFFFFFNDTATTEIYTLPYTTLFRSHHDGEGEAQVGNEWEGVPRRAGHGLRRDQGKQDRKSTRLNSSHGYISYAVFCLKKKKQQIHTGQGAGAGKLAARPAAQLHRAH